jgi:ribonuclease J
VPSTPPPPAKARPNRGPRPDRRGPKNQAPRPGGQPQAAPKPKGPVPIHRGRLRIIPLGGLGEIGKNMMVFEYEQDIIIVDLGFKFPDPSMLGVDYVIPDTSYLEDRKDRIRGIVITHGHEDHIGAVPYIWPKYPVQMFTARLTAGLIEGKLSERRLKGIPQIRVINPETDMLTLGVFKVEFVRVNHSIPDALGVFIHTPVGVFFMTGDFKFDTVPFDGAALLTEKMKRFPQGVRGMLSDSTNVEREGHTLSESSLDESFSRLLDEAPGRLIIASFSSQLNRIQQIITAASSHGRKLAINGRSMLNNVEIATRLGYLKIPQGVLIKMADLSKYPDEKVAVLSTGSQGEPGSGLSRMASGEHKQLKIKKGDTVVFSSSPIPGNEVDVFAVVDNLFREGANVIYDTHMHVHVSGHGLKDEIRQMIEIVKPEHLIPVHGEYHMLVHHAQLGRETGISEEKIHLVDNGQVVEFDANTGKVSSQKVPSGIVLVDGSGVGDIGEIVLRDRQVMSRDGIFVVIMTVNKQTGALVTSPDIISRGFVYVRESEELIHRARAEVKKAFERRATDTPPNASYMKNKVREVLSDLLYQKTKRRPMVLPVLIEI